MLAKGYNPMRWDCHKGGKGENCFNLKRRPKIELFADCFPRGINFGDIDGLVELGGRFLLLEWKGDGGAIKRGQQLTYIEFTRAPGNLVVIVHGNAETMETDGYSFFWKGRQHPFVVADLDGVKQRIRNWAEWTEAGKRDAAE